MTTTIARHSLGARRSRDERADALGEPVELSPAEMTNTAATMMAGSLAKPDRASRRVRMPVRFSASRVSIAARSMRTRLLMKSAQRARKDDEEDELLGFHRTRGSSRVPCR